MKTAFKFTAPLSLNGNKCKPNSAGNRPALTRFSLQPKDVCIELVQMFADKHLSFGSGHFKLSFVLIVSLIEQCVGLETKTPNNVFCNPYHAA